MDNKVLAEPWNRSANEYAEVFKGLINQGVEPTLNAAAVEEGQRVLDVAAGPGNIAAAASAKGAEVIGIDFAENMIAVAKGRHPEIQFEVADAQNLPFDNGIFDAVVMGFALFMLPDPYKALSEVVRVLQPGGQFAATVWDQPLPAFDLFYGVMANYSDEEALQGGPPLNGINDHDVLAAALENAGFTDVTVECLPIIWELNEPEHLWNALSTLRDFSEFSADKISAFQADIVEGAKQWQEGNRYLIPNPALILAGTRV